MVRRPTPRSRVHGYAAGPLTCQGIPTVSRKLISTTSPANSRASTIAAPGFTPAMAGTPAPTQPCRCSARYRASCMSMARERAADNIYCQPATPSPSRCSSRAATMPPKATAGFWPRSGVPAKTAAIWRCSTPSTSTLVRLRWWSSAIGYPMAFTVTGWVRREGGEHPTSSFHDVQLHIVDTPLGAAPESILPILVMDPGFALMRAPDDVSLYFDTV